MIVVVPQTVPAVLNGHVAAGRFKDPLVPLLRVMMQEPGLSMPLSMPPMVTAPFTVTENVPWLLPLDGPAQKRATLPEVHATSEALATCVCVPAGVQFFVVVSHEPLPPILVVPFGSQP